MTPTATQQTTNQPSTPAVESPADEGLLIRWAEQRRLPDWVIRAGIRRLLAKRLKQQSRGNRPARELLAEFAAASQAEPITVEVDSANAQHYEVPAAFYETVLGPRLKYSCGYWPTTGGSLRESEIAMLELTAERAEVANGMEILELGCGWGSLTLFLAEKYRNSSIVAVSNSASQREFILSRAAERGLTNVEVITTDVAKFQTDRQFDRVVSVEMFEHVRNHALLMQRIAGWLRPAGKLFVHIFCHQSYAYQFETNGQNDWMARNFFTGGIMPAYGLLPLFQHDLRLEQDWRVNGTHYERTSNAWLQELDEQADKVTAILGNPRQVQRWRMFFMACAELFGYCGGDEWLVAHYRFGRD